VGLEKAALVGEGMLDSLAWEVWPGRGRCATRRGELVVGGFDATLLVDFTVSTGLLASADGPPWDRTEYGPAVAGLAASSARLLVGRVGAADMPPEFTASVDSGRRRCWAGLELAGVGAAELAPVRTGEKLDMAEPGRAGTFLVAPSAFRPAITVSLSEDLEDPIVLFDRPRPGRAVVVVVAFLGELGLFGSFWSNFCAVLSRPSMILSTRWLLV